jgi:hypothetical protein
VTPDILRACPVPRALPAPLTSVWHWSVRELLGLALRRRMRQHNFNSATATHPPMIAPTLFADSTPVTDPTSWDKLWNR